MNLPPIPLACSHFAKHDFGDGKGPVDIFWCSEPFWSHDHGEPWMLDQSEYFDAMERNTVAAVAYMAWTDEALRRTKAMQAVSVNHPHTKSKAPCKLCADYEVARKKVSVAEDSTRSWLAWRDAK